MSTNHEQWSSCCHFSSGQIGWRWLLDRSAWNFCFLAKMAYFCLIPNGHPFHVSYTIVIARALPQSTCCSGVKYYCNAYDSHELSSPCENQSKNIILLQNSTAHRPVPIIGGSKVRLASDKKPSVPNTHLLLGKIKLYELERRIRRLDSMEIRTVPFRRTEWNDRLTP